MSRHFRESIPNAVMVTSSFDRNFGTTGNPDPTEQPYNNFTVQTRGANIIQGQVNRLKVAEIFFPYNIPTIIQGYGATIPADARDTIADNAHLVLLAPTVTLGAGGTTAAWTVPAININLPTGFYTGTEIVAAINAVIAASPNPAWAGLSVTYDNKTQRITWENTATWNGADGVANTFYILVPAYQIQSPATLGKLATVAQNAEAIQQPQLAWTLGLRELFVRYPPAQVTNAVNLAISGGGGPYKSAAGGPPLLQDNGYWAPSLAPLNYPNVAGASNSLPIFLPGYYPSKIVGGNYTGRYTDYIDIVSPTLCSNQYVRDGNTNQNVVRRDIICRLYIADENSNPLILDASGEPFVVGSRPYTIHRQFQNPKTMFWTAERSINAIDLQLYDMFGLPLPIGNFNTYTPSSTTNTTITCAPSDYGITFLVEEGGASEQGSNIGYRY